MSVIVNQMKMAFHAGNGVITNNTKVYKWRFTHRDGVIQTSLNDVVNGVRDYNQNICFIMSDIDEIFFLTTPTGVGEMCVFGKDGR